MLSRKAEAVEEFPYFRGVKRMIEVTYSIKTDFNHKVKLHLRKDSIIGVYEHGKWTTLFLISGKEIEVHESKEEVLKLLE